MSIVHRKVFLVSLLVNVMLLGVYLFKYNFDLSVLFAIPADSAPARNSLIHDFKYINNAGHDGGLILSVALDPLHPNLEYTGHHFERLLMPLILHVLSGGKLEYLLYLFPLFNILCLAALAWGMGKELERNKYSPWWGLVISLGPWCIMPLRFNLINIFSFLIVWLGIMSFSQRKYIRFLVLGMLASLTFPMTLLYFLIGYGMLMFRENDKRFLFTIPLIFLPMFLYKAYLIWGLDLNINFFVNDLLKSQSKQFAFSINDYIQGYSSHIFQESLSRGIMTFISGLFYLYTAIIGFRHLIKKKTNANIHGLICCTISLLPFFIGGTIFANGMFQVGRFTLIYPSLLITSEDNWARRISSFALVSFAIVSVGWILLSPVM